MCLYAVCFAILHLSSPYDTSSINRHILQVRKLKHRKVKRFTQGSMAKAMLGVRPTSGWLQTSVQLITLCSVPLHWVFCLLGPYCRYRNQAQ